VESRLRFPHSHSLDDYGLLFKTQPTTFPIFNVAGKCEKYWTLPFEISIVNRSMRLFSWITGVVLIPGARLPIIPQAKCGFLEKIELAIMN